MTRETVRLEGLQGVIETLQSLPAELVSNKGGIIKNAARTALKPMRDAAKENVRRIVLEPNVDGLPSDSTGTLEKAIGIRRGKPRGFKGEVMRLSVGRKRYKGRTEKGKPLTAAKVGGLLEHGTEKMTPKPWMRPAYLKHARGALLLFEQDVNKRLQAAVKKNARMNGVAA